MTTNVERIYYQPTIKDNMSLEEDYSKFPNDSQSGNLVDDNREYHNTGLFLQSF